MLRCYVLTVTDGLFSFVGVSRNRAMRLPPGRVSLEDAAMPVSQKPRKKAKAGGSRPKQSEANPEQSPEAALEEHRYGMLQALFDDANGNSKAGNGYRASQYLDALASYAQALSRVERAQYEVGIANELADLASDTEVSDGCETMSRYGERALVLAVLEL